MTQRQAYTAAEFAAMLGVDPSTLYRHVKRRGSYAGVAPVPDTGDRIIFSRAKVDRVLGVEPPTGTGPQPAG